MAHYTIIAWFFSTLIGIFLFLCELAVLVWVKFWRIGKHYKINWISLSSSIILVPVICAFVFFALHFYRKLFSYKFERTERDLEELQVMVDKMHSSPWNLGSFLNFYNVKFISHKMW